jgi:tetratricopeptide (TPR) repeat protein
MIDILILGGLVLVAVGLGIYFLMRALVVPHKLDSIKAMMEAGRYKDAISALNTFMKNDERNPLAHLYLAECYFFSGNYEMAMVEYKQVLTLGKFAKTATERVIRKRLAEIYIQFGQMEEAQKEFVVLAQLDPQNFEYLYSIGKIFYDRGMKDQAMAYLDKVLKVSRNHAPTYFMLGKIFYEMNKAQEALNSFTNCLKLEPRNMEAHFYVGMILKAMGNYGKAITEFEEAEKARENSMKVKAIYQKGLCKLEMGDVDTAIADFERSLKYSSEENNVTIAVRYTLGVAYEKQRRLLEAVEQWEKVAGMRPNFQDVQLKLSQYEDLRIDDKLKDLLTATPTTFEFICQKIADVMGYEVVESRIVGDDHVQIVGVERSAKWRNVRGGKVLVIISRSNQDVAEDEVAALVEKMKAIHGTRAIYVTTGKFTPQAMRYSENRPIHLYDRQKLSSVMKNLS